MTRCGSLILCFLLVYTHTSWCVLVCFAAACSASLPGGNQVDGLQAVAHACATSHMCSDGGRCHTGRIITLRAELHLRIEVLLYESYHEDLTDGSRAQRD